MQNLTKERYRQIQCMQKIQKFKYENESIKYQIERSQNLREIIQQEDEQNITKCFTIGQLFIIINNIVDQLLKVYQISNISKLEMNSIYVNLENNQITFTNIHISKDLVSYEENLNEIIKISYEIFSSHQKFLVSLIRLIDDKNKVDLSKKIQYITEFSNQVLSILKSAKHHKELNQFVQKNIKNIQFTHDLFQDSVEIPKEMLLAQKVQQPPTIKDVPVLQASVQENPLIQKENPLIGKIINQELTEQYQQQENQDCQNEFLVQSQSQQIQQSFEILQSDEVQLKQSQSNIILPQIYAFIEENLKSLQLTDDFYDYMLQYFVKNYKNLQQNEIQEKIELLYNSYYYPKLQNQNIEDDFVKQWQSTISEEFMTNKTLDLNDDCQKFYQKLVNLEKNLWQQQQQY